MDLKSSLVHLNGDNYATWKVQVKMCLIKDDLWRIVNGAEVAPTEAAALAKYNIRKDRALAIIVLAVDPKFLYLLGDPEEPATVWKKLQDSFQKKTWANKLKLKKRLYGLKLAEGGDLQAHLKSLVELFDALAVVGDAIQEEDRVINLLASLPEKYDTIVTTLETLDQVPSWSAVTERLMHEDEKKKGVEDGEKAYFSRKQNNAIICFNCGGKGHIKRNCRKKSVSYAAEKKEEEKDEVVLAAGCPKALQKGLGDQFLFDSACTQHMCNNPSLFTNIKKSAEVNVLVGNGKSVNVSGTGDVLLNLDSGSGISTKCRLKNVLYVPELSHNLLSVSKISDSSKQVNFSKDKCEIVSGKKTIAFGTKVGKLYVLAERRPNLALAVTCSNGRFIKCRNSTNFRHFTCRK